MPSTSPRSRREGNAVSQGSLWARHQAPCSVHRVFHPRQDLGRLGFEPHFTVKETGAQRGVQSPPAPLGKEGQSPASHPGLSHCRPRLLLYPPGATNMGQPTSPAPLMSSPSLGPARAGSDRSSSHQQDQKVALPRSRPGQAGAPCQDRDGGACARAHRVGEPWTGAEGACCH